MYINVLSEFLHIFDLELKIVSLKKQRERNHVYFGE